MTRLRLQDVADDVRELKGQFARHEERHGDDADMLGRVLDSLKEHTDNHHGTLSNVKQGGWVALLVTAAAVAAELAGLLDLVRGLPLPF